MIIPDMNPKYVHDCDNCTFLGRHIYGKVSYDLYVCVGKTPDVVAKYSDVVARYSDRPSDYSSFPVDIYRSNKNYWLETNSELPLLEALFRAEIGGHIDTIL